MKYRNISWEEFDAAVKSLLQKIPNAISRVDYVAAVARGGLVPGVMLSHELDAPLHVIQWSTRDNPFMKRAHLLAIDPVACSHILLVDDINDTGKTFDEIVKHCGYDERNPYSGKLVTASVFQRYNTCTPSDVYGVLIEDDSWIVFPWEVL